MKKLKKITAALCAALMLLTTVPSASAEYTEAETRDADVLIPSVLFRAAIRVMSFTAYPPAPKRW